MPVPRTPRGRWAAQAARDLLAGQGWRHGWDVDVDAFLARLAWKIVYVPMPEQEQEWTFQTPDGRICVFLREHLRMEPKSRRWNQAHAGGHIVLGHLEEFNAVRLTRAEERIVCREADAFARELLLPAETVRHTVQELFPAWRDGLMPAEIGQLSDRFDVSWSTMMYRLDEVRLQDKRLSLALHHLRLDPLHQQYAAQPSGIEDRAWQILQARDPSAVELRDSLLRMQEEDTGDAETGREADEVVRQAFRSAALQPPPFAVTRRPSEEW